MGDGLKVVDNYHGVPMVEKLIKRKQGKCQKKDSKPTVPFGGVGMDIGYNDGFVIDGYKYILILVNSCTTNYFLPNMHSCSGAAFCEALCTKNTH